MSDLSVSNGLVSQGEFSEVLSAHIGLDFDGSPVLSTVNFSDGSDHLGGDDAVSQMSLNTLGLFSIRGVFDGLLQLLDEASVLGVDTTSVSSSGLGVEEVDHSFLIELEKLVEFDTSVNLLLEWLFLWLLL